MADEQQASSADQPGIPVSGEPAGNTTGENVSQEAQQPQSTNTGTAEQATSPQQSVPSKYAGLDLSKLPDDARAEVQAWVDKRERDQMRYITQKSQEIADVKKKAQYYDEFKNSQEYSQFQQWYNQRGTVNSQPNVAVTPQSTPVANKFEAAGFSAEEAAAMAAAVRETVQEVAQYEKQQLGSQLSQLQYQQQVVKAQQDLENLGRLHPDVYDMLDAGVFKPFVEHYCVREGQPLEVAYEKCKDAMTTLQKQGQQVMNKRIQEKKNAVSATPTPAGDRDIIYVEPGATRELTQKRIDEAAFKAALEGRQVRVRVKK